MHTAKAAGGIIYHLLQLQFMGWYVITTGIEVTVVVGYSYNTVMKAPQYLHLSVEIDRRWYCLFLLRGFASCKNATSCDLHCLCPSSVRLPDVKACDQDEPPCQ